MHVTVEELADSQALIDYILQLADEHNPEHIVFLGDQHHNHAVVRVEVLDFWVQNLKKFKHPVIMLIGNHDMSHDASVSAHALRYGCTVIEGAATVEDVRLVSYCHTQE